MLILITIVTHLLSVCYEPGTIHILSLILLITILQISEVTEAQRI